MIFSRRPMCLLWSADGLERQTVIRDSKGGLPVKGSPPWSVGNQAVVSREEPKTTYTAFVDRSGSGRHGRFA